MYTIKEVAKKLYPIRDRHKLEGYMCWEVLGVMGYTDKGQYEAYKQLMVNMSILDKIYKEE